MDKKNYTMPDFFMDPANPTKKELTKWAFGEYLQPIQDFELVVVVEDPLFILSLAEDNNCLQNKFFLKALYIFVGDAVRTNYNTIKLEKIEGLIKKAASSKSEIIKKFAERCAVLVKNPSSYNYEQWGWGLYAND